MSDKELIEEAREFLAGESAQYYDSSLVRDLVDALEARQVDEAAVSEAKKQLGEIQRHFVAIAGSGEIRVYEDTGEKRGIDYQSSVWAKRGERMTRELIEFLGERHKPEPVTGPAFIAKMPPSPESNRSYWSMYCKECGIEEMLMDTADDPRLVARRDDHNAKVHGVVALQPSESDVRERLAGVLDFEGAQVGGCGHEPGDGKDCAHCWPLLLKYADAILAAFPEIGQSSQQEAEQASEAGYEALASDPGYQDYHRQRRAVRRDVADEIEAEIEAEGAPDGVRHNAYKNGLRRALEIAREGR